MRFSLLGRINLNDEASWSQIFMKTGRRLRTTGREVAAAGPLEPSARIPGARGPDLVASVESTRRHRRVGMAGTTGRGTSIAAS